MTIARNDAERLATDALGLAAYTLESDGRLSPFLIVDLGGFRDIEHFGPDEVEEARARAAELGRDLEADQMCALVREGRIEGKGDAILIEVQRPDSSEAEVFSQRFRPKSGRFRSFKLIGELAPVGRPQSAI